MRPAPAVLAAACAAATVVLYVVAFALSAGRRLDSSLFPRVSQAGLEPVHFVEELGNLLNLVDHHLANGCASRELSPEEFGVLQVAAVLFSLEQIEPQGVRIRCLQ